MSYKTILVQGGVDDEAGPRLALAAGVAKLFGGAILGVGAEACVPPMPGYMFADASIYQKLREDAEAHLQEAEKRFAETFRGARVQTHWVSTLDFPRDVMAFHARAADLIVTRRSPDMGPQRVATPAELVMEAGPPVLVGPADRTDLKGGTVIVAWKDTRECRRALWDALPFLARAKMVVLVHVVETETASAPVRALDDVMLRLSRHGVTAKAQIVEKAKRPAGAEIVAAAEQQGADLIVLGAYGHSRLREWAFGGVTQELIAGAPQFVLFSH